VVYNIIIYVIGIPRRFRNLIATAYYIKRMIYIPMRQFGISDYKPIDVYHVKGFLMNSVLWIYILYYYIIKSTAVNGCNCTTTTTTTTTMVTYFNTRCILIAVRICHVRGGYNAIYNVYILIWCIPVGYIHMWFGP